MAGSTLIGRSGQGGQLPSEPSSSPSPQSAQPVQTRAPRLPRPWRRSPSLPLSCDEVHEALPGILDGTSSASGPLIDHVELCLACQAELARYRRLLRMLRQLRTAETSAAVPPVPPGIVADVLASLEVAAKRRAVRSVLTGRRLAYAGAVAAAGGAATALVLVTVWRTRVRASEESRVAV